METLEQQIQIINLGKLLVQELGLDQSVDTLARWMAHYIAEKMELLERLPESKEKDDAKKDCFETILDLWKHRWLLPSGRRPLESFEPILRVIERINPEKEEPFFYRFSDHDLSEINTESSNEKEINDYLNIALQIDRTAKIWINDILTQAALKAKNENTELILKNAVTLSDNDDTKIIQLILHNDPSFDIENYDKEGFNEKYENEKLNKRIGELEKFSDLNEYLLNIYKNKLLQEKDDK